MRSFRSPQGRDRTTSRGGQGKGSLTVHNITEGIGIAAPMLKARPPLWLFPALTLLAGGPATLGLWLGSLAFAPQWAALALAIGAGAILQVVVEVGTFVARSDKRGAATFLSVPTMAGLAFGVTLMYATAMLVKI
jgi:zinc transporter, ZIP family